MTLECVIRLLARGYNLGAIELEKKWKVGRGGGGRLDVRVLNPDDSTFAMVECKTWGGEYAAERNKMLDDGGQLFGYYAQDRDAAHLVLYTSRVNGGKIDFTAEGVDAAGLSGSDRDAIYSSWDGRFILRSIFDEAAPPYASRRKVLAPEDLIDLDQAAGEALFGSFARVLRRHAVSDKANAFNRIFTLFVCKIRDEDSAVEGKPLRFQSRDDHSDEG